jgi:hypothetical protein
MLLMTGKAPDCADTIEAGAISAPAASARRTDLKNLVNRFIQKGVRQLSGCPDSRRNPLF